MTKSTHNTENTETVESLMDQAEALPYGAAQKLELLERAVDLADSLGDIQAGFEARQELTGAATMGGHPEKTLVAFAWQLAAWDKYGPSSGREELEADEYDLLWHYKWVINSLWEFPNISRTQIEAAFADFESRLERGGYSLRTALYFRWKYAFFTGQLEQTEAWRTQWLRARKDDMSDCSACEAQFLTDYWVGMGQYLEALKAAKPILSGFERCAEVPHTTLGSVLEPLLRTGQLEEAMDAHVRGYALVQSNPSFLSTCGDHLSFLALTHNLEAAFKLLEKHLPWALSSADLMGRFGFFRSTLPLFARLRVAGQTLFPFRAPQGFPLEGGPEGHTLDALEGWFKTQLEDLATQFDARNGNAYFSSQLTLDPDLLERIPAVSIKSNKFSAKLNNWKGKA